MVMNKPFVPDTIVPILADVAVSISDLKRNPAAVVKAAGSRQVAVLNRNKPVAYVVSPAVWEHIVELFDDRRLVREAQAALEEDGDDIPVNLDDYL